MKIGYGPVAASTFSTESLARFAAHIESKGFEFLWITADPDALILSSIALTATSDITVLAQLNRPLDPLRDAEDIAVLDQLSGRRIALVLGDAAVEDIDRYQDLQDALTGRRVRGVRVYPRTLQFTIPIFTHCSYDVDLPLSFSISNAVGSGDLIYFASPNDAISSRLSVLEHMPMAISIINDTFRDEIPNSLLISESLLNGPGTSKLDAAIRGRNLPPSDLRSSFHSPR